MVTLSPVKPARQKSITTLATYFIALQTILILCVFLHSILQRLRNKLNINCAFSH